MDRFQTSLARYLEQPGIKQDDLATLIGRTQAALSRYASGTRFPDRATAALIDRHTDGKVPLAAWEADALARLGFDKAPSPASVAA